MVNYLTLSSMAVGSSLQSLWGLQNIVVLKEIVNLSWRDHEAVGSNLQSLWGLNNIVAGKCLILSSRAQWAVGSSFQGLS